MKITDRFFLFLSAGIILTLSVSFLTLFSWPWERTLFFNSDFETGTLENWTAEGGTAFLNQPTYGDAPRARGASPAALRGKWFIGTFENRSDRSVPAGSFQGDAPYGKLVSTKFTIARPEIVFLLGGGNGTAQTSVELEVDGSIVLTEIARGIRSGSETMRRVHWNVSAWVGKVARVILKDQSSSSWGHLNADDFRYGFLVDSRGIW